MADNKSFLYGEDADTEHRELRVRTPDGVVIIRPHKVTREEWEEVQAKRARATGLAAEDS